MYEHKHKRKEGARMRIREYILSFGGYTLYIHITYNNRNDQKTVLLNYNSFIGHSTGILLILSVLLGRVALWKPGRGRRSLDEDAAQC